MPIFNGKSERVSLVICLILGVGSESGERGSRVQVGTSDSHRPDGKNQQEVIHWHTRYMNQNCILLRSGKCLAFLVLLLKITAIRVVHLFMLCVVIFFNQFNCPLILQWAATIFRLSLHFTDFLFSVYNSILFICFSLGVFELCSYILILLLIFDIYILRGVAARALHLSRGVEKPSGRVTYVVVLEGLCRFSVQELSTRGTYYTARISPLEMTKSGMLPI